MFQGGLCNFLARFVVALNFDVDVDHDDEDDDDEGVFSQLFSISFLVV